MVVVGMSGMKKMPRRAVALLIALSTGGHTLVALAETKVLVCVATGSYGKRTQAFDLDLTRGTITTRVGDAFSRTETYQATITEDSVRWNDGTARSIDRPEFMPTLSMVAGSVPTMYVVRLKNRNSDDWSSTSV